METASTWAEGDLLSKVARAGLGTQPDQADTATMGTAMASIAFPSLQTDRDTAITTLMDSTDRGLHDNRDNSRRTPGSTPESGQSCPPLTQSGCMARG